MPLKVVNEARGRILADRAEEARDFWGRFRGLMGRSELPMGQGLHLVPCNSIHTFFMRIPIDALFLDASGAVVKSFQALPPWRVTGVYRQARSVLELPAGTVAGSGTQEGDQLSLQHFSV